MSINSIIGYIVQGYSDITKIDGKYIKPQTIMNISEGWRVSQ